MEHLPSVLKDEAIVRTDGNLATIGKSMIFLIGLVIGELILYWHQPAYMLHLIIMFCLNLSMFYILFRDTLYVEELPMPSGKVSRDINDVRGRKDLKNIKDVKVINLHKSMRCYLTSLNTHPNNPEKNNIVIIQSLTHPKTELIACVRLNNVALQIRPNYLDFMRKLYEIQSHIPFCVQIAVKESIRDSTINSFQNWSNEKNLFGHQIPESGIKEGKEFSYNFILTRTFPEHPTLQNTFPMLVKMRQILAEFLMVLEVNFPHFRFNQVCELDLLNVLSAPVSSPNLNDYFDIKSQYNFRGFGKMVLYILNVIIGMIILMESYPFFRYIGLGLCICIGIWGIYSFMIEQYLGSLNSVTFQRINLYPHVMWLKDANDRLMLYNNLTQELTLLVFHSLQYLNRFFRFNPNKFFRSLLSSSLFNSEKNCIILQNFFNRVLSTDFHLEYFNEERLNAQLSSFNSYTRDCGGFYEYQPLFIFGKTLKVDLSTLIIANLDRFYQEIAQNFVSILQANFSHCPIIAIHWQSALTQFIAKDRAFLRFGTHLPIQFNTGLHLSPFLEIPDEIHKSVPAFYPGEFISPVLHDDYEFGHVINTENGQLESPAGISIDDLLGNVLVTGQDPQVTVAHFMQIIWGLLSTSRLDATHEIVPDPIPKDAFNSINIFKTNMILFDYSGNMHHLIPLLMESDADSFRYFQVGKNFGINLFDTPFNRHNSEFFNYVTQIMNLFEILFNLHDADKALLQNAWEGQKFTAVIQLSAVAKSITDSFDDKGGTRRLQSAILSYLSLLGNENLKIAFDSDLKRGITFSELFATKLIIIDVSEIGNRVYRLLFIYAFLHQLLLIKKSQSEFNAQSQIIAFNELHNVYNRGIFHERFELFDQLLQNRCILLAECNSIASVNPNFSALFQNIYCARILNKADLTIMMPLLNHDAHFTNIYSKTARKVSYQDMYLKTLEDSKAIVLRKSQRFPFIFQFNSPLPSKDRRKSSPPLLNYRQFQLNQTALKVEVSPDIAQKSQLEINFMRYGKVFPCIVIFLENLKKIQKSSPVNSMVNLERDLVDLVNHRAETQGQSSVENIQRVREIINELIQFGYLISEVMKIPSSSLEIDGYRLSDQAITHLEEYRNINALNHALSEIHQSTEFGDNPSFLNSPNVLNAPNCPTISDDTTQFLHKSLDDRSMEILLRNLPDIVVQAKIKSQQGAVAEACDQLDCGLQELLHSIKKESIPRRILERLESTLNSIIPVREENSQERLNLIIGGLEEAYITIPDLPNLS